MDDPALVLFAMFGVAGLIAILINIIVDHAPEMDP
jgi:hypothetical protein